MEYEFLIKTISEIQQELKQIKQRLENLENNKETIYEQKSVEPYEYVYCHILPNKKTYIGIAKNPEERWQKGLGYKTNKDFYTDIQKYGWNNIKHLIIGKSKIGHMKNNIDTTELEKNYTREGVEICE